MEAATLEPQVGTLLRAWRGRRSLSQLELSLESRISARHLSFVETGRSKPSRATVIRLAEALQVPLRERNALLLAAGYAPVYTERAFASEEMATIRVALDRFLRAHEPYRALVVDRRHNLLAANDALSALTAGCSPELLEQPANAIRIALHPEGMAPRTANLAEWSARLLSRLRREAAITGDSELEALHEEVAAYPGVVATAPADASPAWSSLRPCGYATAIRSCPSSRRSRPSELPSTSRSPSSPSRPSTRPPPRRRCA
jgi:transcriptional regulator with XRE-family HTH domain